MAQPTYQELLEENRQLRQIVAQQAATIARLEARVLQLQTRIGELEQRLDRATRAAKRQAAPFSKGPPKDKPQRPGRKSGPEYGPKAHRPLPSQTPDEIHNVPLPEQCPDCGGHVQEERIDPQFQVEIPRKPLLRRFDIHAGRCTACGRGVRPRHPLQTSPATGAAASQTGPDLQAIIALMKDKYGLSYVVEPCTGGQAASGTRGMAVQEPRSTRECVPRAAAMRTHGCGHVLHARATMVPRRMVKR